MKKRIRRRKFFSGEVNHVYQRTRNGFNIFYDLEDYLVYFTIFSVSARKYDVVVMGLCLMIDHLHMLLKTGDRVTLSEFVRQVTSVFVMEYNSSVGRKGPLFTHRFGSAPKLGDKKIRTAIAYLFNNPVEKLICRLVQDYRWNFLAYMKSPIPFSDRKHSMAPSRKLQRAISEVYAAYNQNNYLHYSQLRRMMKNLNTSEREYLADYIINLYNPIEYDEIVSYYGSYESMLQALNSNTGAEYDIREKYSPYSDVIYDKISEYLLNSQKLSSLRTVITFSLDEKLKLCERMKMLAPNSILCKYLHVQTCAK